MQLLQINLLPVQYRAAKKDLTWLTDRRIIWPTVFLLTALFGGFTVWLNINDTLTQLNFELTRVRDEIEKNRPILEKIKQLDERLKVIAQKNKALKSIQVSKKRWVILFEDISSVLPPNMWLTSLIEVAPNVMELKGTTYDFSEIAEYMVNLERRVSFVSVALVSIEKQTIGSDQAYSYTLKCSINPDLGMEDAAR